MGLGKWMKSDTLHRIPDVHRTFVSRLVATSNTYANFLSLVSHPRSITHQSLSKITKCPPVKSFQAVTLSDSRHWTGLIELCTDRWAVLCLAWPGTACQNAGAVTSMSEKGRYKPNVRGGVFYWDSMNFRSEGLETESGGWRPEVPSLGHAEVGLKEEHAAVSEVQVPRQARLHQLQGRQEQGRGQRQLRIQVSETGHQ